MSLTHGHSLLFYLLFFLFIRIVIVLLDFIAGRKCYAFYKYYKYYIYISKYYNTIYWTCLIQYKDVHLIYCFSCPTSYRLLIPCQLRLYFSFSLALLYWNHFILVSPIISFTSFLSFNSHVEE